MKDEVTRVDETIKKYLSESHLLQDPDCIDEVLNINYDDTRDVASLSTGLRRIDVFMARATTPKKYVILARMVADLIEKFPMKAKMILGRVASAYGERFTPTTEV
jgi:hypothetical protein